MRLYSTHEHYKGITNLLFSAYLHLDTAFSNYKFALIWITDLFRGIIPTPITFHYLFVVRHYFEITAAHIYKFLCREMEKEKNFMTSRYLYCQSSNKFSHA